MFYVIMVSMKYVNMKNLFYVKYCKTCLLNWLILKIIRVIGLLT